MRDKDARSAHAPGGPGRTNGMECCVLQHNIWTSNLKGALRL